MLVDLSAIRDAAAKRESNHWLMANAANPANLANQKPESPDELAKLATLAGLAISHGLEAPPPDPGMARLLALADRYCTAIQASDKARQDWRSDIEATAPNNRQGLAAYLLAKLVPVVPASNCTTPISRWPPVSASLVPSQTRPLPKFDSAQPWNALDREFQAHYWQCPACKAGGRSRGPLCPQGQQLSAAVDQAFAAD